MRNLSDLVPSEIPWDGTASGFTNRNIIIKAMEPTETSKGPAYLCLVDTTDDDGEPLTDFRLLIGAQVLVQRLDRLPDALRDEGDDFPVACQIRWVRGHDNRYMDFAEAQDMD